MTTNSIGFGFILQRPEGNISSMHSALQLHAPTENETLDILFLVPAREHWFSTMTSAIDHVFSPPRWYLGIDCLTRNDVIDVVNFRNSWISVIYCAPFFCSSPGSSTGNEGSNEWRQGHWSRGFLQRTEKDTKYALLCSETQSLYFNGAVKNHHHSSFFRKARRTNVPEEILSLRKRCVWTDVLSHLMYHCDGDGFTAYSWGTNELI